MNFPIPFTKDNKIALAFSGGGFRAACFSLGALSYMHRIGVSHEHIRFITSTSGGSITAMTYLAAMPTTDEAFQAYYENMRELIEGRELQEQALDTLTKSDELFQNLPFKQRNIINSFAYVYQSCLFNKDLKCSNKHPKCNDNCQKCRNLNLKWGDLKGNGITLWVNATEFHHGFSFRFRTDSTWGHKSLEVKIGMDEIELGNILAASSCFPGGFEPIVYPDDFCRADAATLQSWRDQIGFSPRDKYDQKPEKISLLDGGVLDNQGLGALLEYYNRDENQQYKTTDSVFVVDVTSFFMDGFDAPPKEEVKDIGWLKKIVISVLMKTSLRFFLYTLASLSLLFIAGLVTIAYHYSSFWIYVLAGAAALAWGLVLWIALLFRGFVENKVQSIINKDYLEDTLNYLEKLPLKDIWKLVEVRMKSLITMSSELNLKTNRMEQFADFYSDENFKKNKTSVLIYELSERNETNFKEKIKKDKKGYKTLRSWLDFDNMDLSKIRAVAEDARAMETTLWFNDAKKETQADILACGQFTMCFNLLKYLARLKEDGVEVDDLYGDMKKQLLADWGRFLEKPRFMAKNLPPRP